MVDEDRITWPLRAAYNWAKYGIVPDINHMAYRDAVICMACYDCLRDEPADPREEQSGDKT